MYVSDALIVKEAYVFNVQVLDVLALTLFMKMAAHDTDVLRPEQIFGPIFYFYQQRTI